MPYERGQNRNSKWKFKKREIPSSFYTTLDDTPTDVIKNKLSFREYNSYKSLDLVNKENNFQFDVDSTYSANRPHLTFYPLKHDYTFDERWGTLLNLTGALYPDFNIMNVVLHSFSAHFLIKMPPNYIDVFRDGQTKPSEYPIIVLLNKIIKQTLQLSNGKGANKWKTDVVKYLNYSSKEPICEVTERKGQLHQGHIIETINGVQVEDPTYDFIQVHVVHPKIITLISELFLKQEQFKTKLKRDSSYNQKDNNVKSEEDELVDLFDAMDDDGSIPVTKDTLFRETKRRRGEDPDIAIMKALEPKDEDQKTPLEKTLETITKFNRFCKSVEKVDICNANIDVINRWLTDMNYKPSQWFELSNYAIVHSKLFKYPQPNMLPKRFSTCELEVVLFHKEFTLIKDELQRKIYENIIPDVRVMSWDFEMRPNKNNFPTAVIDEIVDGGKVGTHCPIISFTAVEHKLMSPKIMKKFVFQLNSVKSWSKDVNLIQYDSEQLIVMAVCNFFSDMDPTVLVTHNGDDCDFPYLFDTLQRYGIWEQYGPLIGRSIGVTPTAQKSNFVVKGRKSTKITIGGRINIDLLPRAREEFNLPSNTLNFLALKFLDETKEDLPHWLIEREFNRNADGRTRIARYGMKDSILTSKLFTKLKFFLSFIVVSNIAMLPVQVCLDRSSGFRVVSAIQVECYRDNRFRVTILVAEKGKKYKGGDCMKPKRGIYEKWITATLDFSSMYPSIMMGYNLDHTTRITKETIMALGWIKDVDYWQRPKYALVNGEVKAIEDPDGPCFVASKRKVGIIPRIQQELKVVRSRIRNVDIKKLEELLDVKKAEHKTSVKENETNPSSTVKGKITVISLEMDTISFEIDYLDIRQNKVKIFQNSMYGKCGDPSCEIYDPVIAETVTLTGKALLMLVRVTTNQQFMSFWFFLVFLYGDTDSVFVFMIGIENIGEAMSLGLMIVNAANKKFPKQITIAFEKVLEKLNLIGGKNYTFLKTEIGKESKFEAKGIKAIKKSGSPMSNIPALEAITMYTYSGVLLPSILHLRKHRYNMINRKIHSSYFVQRQVLNHSPGHYKSNANVLKIIKQMKDVDNSRVVDAGETLFYLIGENENFLSKNGAKIKVGNVIYWAPEAIRTGKRYNVKYYVDMFDSDQVNYFRFHIAKFLGIKIQLKETETKTEIIDKDDESQDISFEQESTSREVKNFNTKIADVLFNWDIKEVRNLELKYRGLTEDDVKGNPLWTIPNKKCIKVVSSLNQSTIRKNDPLGRFLKVAVAKCKRCFVGDVTKARLTVKQNQNNNVTKFVSRQNPYCSKCWKLIFMESTHACSLCTLPQQCMVKLESNIKHKCAMCQKMQAPAATCYQQIIQEELQKYAERNEKQFIKAKLEWKNAFNACIYCIGSGNQTLYEQSKAERKLAYETTKNKEALDEPYNQDYDPQECDKDVEKYIKDPFNPNSNIPLRLVHSTVDEVAIESVNVCQFLDCPNLKKKYDINDKLKRRLNKLGEFRGELKWIQLKQLNW